MGCFNVSGCLSQLPICGNKEVVCMIGAYPTLNPNFDGSYYPTSVISPYCLPIYGKYNDYGALEDIERTPIVEFIETLFNWDIDRILEQISRLGGRTIKECINYWDKSENKTEVNEFKKLLPINKNIAIDERYEKYCFMLMFEHRHVWDSLIKKGGAYVNNDHIGTFFNYVEKYGNFYNGLDNEKEKMLVGNATPNFFSGEAYMNPVMSILLDIDCNEASLLQIMPLTNKLKSFNKENEEMRFIKPLFPRTDNPYFMGFFKQLNPNQKIQFYEKFKNEIIAFCNVFHFLDRIPMAFVPSMKGRQDLDYKLYDEAINLFKETSSLIQSKI